ncbi:putative GAG protein [Labeo rohita]|uniref:Putative GAG protein n=1 Tax=Labeo rohita TaxID=84645 RepID=A0A498NR90_LABRO|nr:putative GAG protein [Labeo rohita]
MASASSASEGARGKDAPRPCACGAMISAKDTHPLCIVCLGVRHAQAALANPECCPHCSPFPSRVLERRVRVAATNKGDPSLSPPTTVETKQPPVSCSWGDFMDEVSPELPPVFPILAEEREEEDDDDEAIARLLEEDGEEDDDGSPASAQVELDLLEMCRRAVAKLSINWPSQQAGQGMKRDLYDGKRLPSRAPAVKQVIPAVPACVSEMKRFWDKPFSHRVPVKGFSRLDVHNMEELGMSNPPPVELSIDFLDAPVEPKALFGASVTAMRQRCDLRKQEGEAFQACLPRKPIPKGPPSTRPGFDAPLRSGQSAFRSPRPPQSQQSDAQSKPAQPKGKPSLQQQLNIDRQTLREGRNTGQPNRSSCSGQRDEQQHSWSICCYSPSKRAVNFSPSCQEKALDSGIVHRNVKKFQFPQCPTKKFSPLHPRCCRERWKAVRKRILVV